MWIFEYMYFWGEQVWPTASHRQLNLRCWFCLCGFADPFWFCWRQKKTRDSYIDWIRSEGWGHETYSYDLSQNPGTVVFSGFRIKIIHPIARWSSGMDPSPHQSPSGWNSHFALDELYATCQKTGAESRREFFSPGDFFSWSVLFSVPYIYPATSLPCCMLFAAFWSWNLSFCVLFAAFWSWNLPCCMLFAAFWSWNFLFCRLFAAFGRRNLPFIMLFAAFARRNLSVCVLFVEFGSWNLLCCCVCCCYVCCCYVCCCAVCCCCLCCVCCCDVCCCDVCCCDGCCCDGCCCDACCCDRCCYCVYCCYGCCCCCCWRCANK